MELSDDEINSRRKAEMKHGKNAFKPQGRDRKISPALQFYGMHATSADKGAVRELPEDNK